MDVAQAIRLKRAVRSLCRATSARRGDPGDPAGRPARPIGQEHSTLEFHRGSRTDQPRGLEPDRDLRRASGRRPAGGGHSYAGSGATVVDPLRCRPGGGLASRSGDKPDFFIRCASGLRGQHLHILDVASSPVPSSRKPVATSIWPRNGTQHASRRVGTRHRLLPGYHLRAGAGAVDPRFSR